MAIHGTVSGVDGADVDFADVDFISFVSSDTYGKPAIIAPGTPDFAPASERGAVTVLYINPRNIVSCKATKESE